MQMMTNTSMMQRCMNALVMRRVSTAASPQFAAEDYDAAKPFHEIPGPRPLPIIGNTHRIMAGSYDFANMINLQKQLNAEYGNIVRFSGLPGRNDLLFVYDPENVSKVFRVTGEPWPERPSFRSLRYYRKVMHKDLFQGLDGVMNDQGEAWQKARSQVNPVMLQSRVVEQYTGRINEVAEDFVVRMPEWIGQNNKTPHDFVNEFHKWALESIAVIALDTRLGCLEKNLAPDSEPQKMIYAVGTLFECIHKLENGPGAWQYVNTPTWRKFEKTMDFFVEICMKYINKVMERVKLEGHKDEETVAGVLEMLLRRDPNTIRVVIMAIDMLFAGVDTTSYSIINTLLHLCKNQEAQEKLYNEVKTHMPDPSTPLTTEVLNEMKYLRACIRESLRLTPVVHGNVRTTHSKMVLSNYQIPTNVDIIMANGSMCQMDKHFPEATKYIPERFMREQGQETKHNPYISLPFGHGARKCIGMRFASMEMEMLLAKLVRRYHWEWHEPEMRYETPLVLKPMNPLRFTVTPREL